MKRTLRQWAGIVCMTISAPLLFVASTPVQAFEFDNGPIRGNIDTTLSYGASNRVESQDKDIICTANGGTAYGCNSDDGNLNYDRGTISRVFKVTTDIEINHKTRDIGAFFRVKGVLDTANNNSDDVERGLPDDTIDLIGQDFKFLDYYGWSRFEMGGGSAEIRFGSHVLNWGESTFIQGGINAINPIDASAIRLPGAELREALLPVPMISMSWDATDSLSVEGFYQLDWKETIPDPSGSYLSVNDFAVDGGTKVQLGFGDFSDQGRAAQPTFTTAFIGAGVPAASAPLLAFGTDLAIASDIGGAYLARNDFLTVDRDKDEEAKDGGQWGIALRYFSEELNDTEFGFYYMNYHSRLPVISARAGTLAGAIAAAGAGAAVAGGNTGTFLAGNGLAAAIPSVANAVAVDQYAQTANYFVEYPEDIKLIGLSFNTNAGLWAIQGEFSHKKDAPLQIDDVELLFHALSPLGSAFVFNQLGTLSMPTDERAYLQGYIERDVSQLQATATRIFSNVMGADEFVFVAEAAVTHVHDMPSKNELRLNGPGTFTSGNPFHFTTGAHAGKRHEDSDAFPDATSWGYRLAGRWTFNDVYQSINLQPRVAFQHDVDGITPGPGGNFIEDRKAITLGLGANYKNQWSADISYTSFFGAGRHNLVGDRDFLAFNLKYSF